jgi:hypothetical protein
VRHAAIVVTQPALAELQSRVDGQKGRAA